MRTGSIYIIRNTVNDKVYIGQTTMPVRERFMTHMKPSTLKQKRNYKLYNAVLKYGRSAFYVETLEENVPLNLIDEREIYYISQFNSYECGYNSTKGGDGRIFNKLDNEDEVVAMAQTGHSVKEIAAYFGVHAATVSRTLSRRGIKMYQRISKERLEALVADGVSNIVIAKIHHVDTETVLRALKRYGMQRYKTRRGKRQNFNPDEIHADYLNQMSIEEICKKHDISRTTFYRIKDSGKWELRPQIYKHKTRYHESTQGKANPDGKSD